MGRTIFLIAICAVLAIACGKRPAPTGAVDAAPIVLTPIELDAAPLEPTTPPPAGHPEWDIPDLPPDAGDARCPPTDAGQSRQKQVDVKLVLRRHPVPSLDLVIPALGKRKVLWKGDSPNPNSCSASFDKTAERLVFRCSEVMTVSGGHVYARGSDVIVVERPMGPGAKASRVLLPCGTVARFTEPACPAGCWNHHPGCECTQLGPPPPASTSVR